MRLERHLRTELLLYRQGGGLHALQQRRVFVLHLEPNGECTGGQLDLLVERVRGADEPVVGVGDDDQRRAEGGRVQEGVDARGEGRDGAGRRHGEGVRQGQFKHRSALRRGITGGARLDSGTLHMWHIVGVGWWVSVHVCVGGKSKPKW